jgi:hypothetical protein
MAAIRAAIATNMVDRSSLCAVDRSQIVEMIADAVLV